jgi:hypothetical protein
VEPDSEDDAWRSIVEHYGDRVPIDPEEPGVDPDTDPVAETPPGEDAVRRDGDEERFVPPPPPPLPRVAPDRLLAWTGVFGTPVVLLTAVVTGLHLPGWLGYLLVGAFVGGFVYLVSRMPRGPRDPADDGARL